MASELVVDGWFVEKEALWPGQRFSLKVQEILHESRSEFQVNIDMTTICFCFLFFLL